MKIVVTHIRNEEYLLGWWIKHHHEKFDHGVIIDYNSSDNSMEIIKTLAPTWDIIPSRNVFFDSIECDREVVDVQKSLYEKYPDAWIITLTITEFLIGNTDVLNNRFDKQKVFIPVYPMVDKEEDNFAEPNPNSSLVQQRMNGIHWTNPNIICYTNMEAGGYFNKDCRCLHNFPVDYLEVQGGRHYSVSPEFISNEFGILWYFFSPFTENFIKRRLSIKENISQEDKQKNRGIQHMMDRELLYKMFKQHQTYAIDLSEEIQKFK
jgi:hypothetical protein